MFFAALMCIPWIGERDFYTRGEPREALVPQRMIETSNWILPRTFDDRVPSKPPFTHWLIGASSYLRSLSTGRFVVDEWSSRLPAAALSLLFLAAFYVFIERQLNSERALHTTLILLTSLEWSRGMVSARVDTVLSVMLGFALLALFSFVERRSFFALTVGIVALVAATLTKGPVALVLPGLIIAVYLCSTSRPLIKTIQTGFQFFVPALLLSAGWYYLAYQVGGDDFLNKFWYENVQRFASSTDDAPHDHSVFYLLLMMIVGLLPWSIVGVSALARFFRISERITRVRKRYRELEAIDKYAVIVTVLFFLFFAIPSSKRGVYLLPSFPFAALLLSRLTASPVSKLFARVSRATALFASVALGALIAFIVLSPTFALNEFHMDLMRSEYAQVVLRPFSWVLLAIIFSFGRFYFRYGAADRDYFTRLGFYCCALLAFVQGPVVNGFAAAVSERRLAAQVAALHSELPLFGYQFEFYGTIFYLGVPVSLTGWSTAPHGLILVKERDYERFKRDLGHDGATVVLGKSAGSVVKIGERVLIVEFKRSGALPVSA